MSLITDAKAKEKTFIDPTSGDQGAIQMMEAIEGAVVMNPVLVICHREAALLIQDLQPHHTVASQGGDTEWMT